MSRSPKVATGRVSTLLALGACAAAVSAAFAHFAIDVVGDFALPHDAYDGVAHSSRELAGGIALFLAVVLAARGFRICCEVAATYRHRLPQPVFSGRERFAFVFSTIATSLALVPAMECLDGRLDGVAIAGLSGAFGGSIPLGAGTTALCAGLVAWLVYAVAHWLISHRDAFTIVIATLLRRHGGAVRPRAEDLAYQLRTPRRRRDPHALCLCKRGPPHGAHCVHHFSTQLLRGDSREILLSSRVARAGGARDVAERCRAA